VLGVKATSSLFEGAAGAASTEKIVVGGRGGCPGQNGGGIYLGFSGRWRQAAGLGSSLSPVAVRRLGGAWGDAPISPAGPPLAEQRRGGEGDPPMLCTAGIRPQGHDLVFGPRSWPFGAQP
jgi:hypothetical protein